MMPTTSLISSDQIQTFTSNDGIDAACQVAHVRPRVVLESAAPRVVIALARTAYGTAVVPSTVRIPRQGLRVTPLVHRGRSIGRSAGGQWRPGTRRDFCPPFAEQFIEAIVTSVQRDYPGREFTRHAPPIPSPKMRLG
jgi:LysR family cyn operon transcriptional activator